MKTTSLTLTSKLALLLFLGLFVQGNLYSKGSDNLELDNISLDDDFVPLSGSISSIVNVNCQGASTGSLTVTALSGIANYTYDWSNGASTSNTASINNTISGLAVGTYTVTITDGSGTTATASASVDLNLQSIMISEFMANPDGAQATNEYVEFYNYGSCSIDIQNFRLKDEDGENNIITTGSFVVGPGEFFIVTNNKSIFESKWFGGKSLSNVFEVVGLALDNGPDEIIITDDLNNILWSIAYLNDETRTTATWISVAITSPNVYGSKANPGINRDGIDITGSLGYQKNNKTPDPFAYRSSTGNIGSPLNGTAFGADVTSNKAVTCNGSDGEVDAVVFGGIAPYTYLWNTGSTSVSLTGLPTSTYTVTITDNNGLSAVDTFKLKSTPLINARVDVDSNESCTGKSDGGVSAFTNAGTAPLTYLWNTGSTNISLSSISGASYTVTITDAFGCTDVATNDVIVVDPTCGAPSGLRTIFIQDTSATLEWQTVPSAITYKIVVKESRQANWTDVYFKQTNIGRFVVDNLTSNTNYTWSIMAKLPSGWTKLAYTERFTTLANTCLNPSSASVSPVQSTQAKLTWTLMPGTVKNRIRYRQVGGGSWNVLGISAPRNFKWITGLTPATNYEWQVKTVCGYGTSASGNIWSNTMFFTTDPAPSPAAFHVNGNMPVENSFSTIKLNAFPNPSNGNITIDIESIEDYRVIVSDMKGLVVWDESTTSEAQRDKKLAFTGLNQGVYSVRVIGETEQKILRFLVR